MGIQDRRYNQNSGDYGEGGGFRRALRRVFVEGDNFFSWALPLFRVAGISVRIHIFYIIFLAAKLIWPIFPGTEGFIFTASLFGAMFVFVLLHEFGHVIACRKVGGEADEIVMWPLGGLAMCRPPRNWKANLITTIWGPLVNVGLAVIFAVVLLAVGASGGSLLFNPFQPWVAVASDPWFAHPAALWKQFLYACYQANVFLVLFNVLLPMFPMDGGRILQEIIWWKKGERTSLLIATNVGLVLAVLIGVATLATGNTGTLFAIAVFAGITCFNERQRARFMEEAPAWAYDTDRGYGGLPPVTKESKAADKAYQAALKRQQKERDEQAELDRLLEKISSSGMQSLTRKEQARLREITERKRGVG